MCEKSKLLIFNNIYFHSKKLHPSYYISLKKLNSRSIVETRSLIEAFNHSKVLREFIDLILSEQIAIEWLKADKFGC